nr:serine/threonine-protein kinase [Kofleriaceae bacterium]
MAERFGAWELERLIAVGGTAEVWRTLDANGRAVALKRLHTHLMRNDEARALFATETRVATVLPRHPSVVHAAAAGDVDTRPWLALEMAPGVTLRQLVSPAPTRDDASPAATRIKLEHAMRVVAAAADGAAHLHGEGWVHGDINPGNLVVDGAEVVVIDLGVARRAGDGGTVRGTHAYMAPEQVRGEAWTPATDVFALGVVLWELVAGARLFHRGPPWLSMAAVVEYTPAPLADARADAIARAALAKDPAARLASASELASRLRELASN